ncbi:MAG TPA: efflux RND transporter permease subunit [Vicinamibacteria bacterium]|nr:efflux RND transporter permease subunit [Vicinamibacteria bacterium]
MLDSLIRSSLEHRLVVLALALAFLVYGGFVAARMPVDVFPDLTVPTVTLVTESKGLAPEEVELLVTFPIETAVMGRPGVERVRSASAYGLSLVYVEFAPGIDVFRARQLVAEKLPELRLPEGVSPPLLGPVSSTMGEILLISMTSTKTSPMELRSLAEWVVRPRLLAVPGVAQVVLIGGETRQFQVLVDPAKLRDHELSLEDVVAAAEASNASSGGGFLEVAHTEYLVRGRARVLSVSDLASSVVAVRDSVPILIGNVATVREGPALKRGDGSFNGAPAVVATIQKGPEANTLSLTREIETALAALAPTLPPDVRLDTKAFQQADFIQRAVANVSSAVVESAILVVLVLFFFLWSFRTTFITLTAIPLSLLAAVVALRYFGLGFNTMTLGGLAIAIGELVDDAIVDVENVFRRLRQNRERGSPAPLLHVVFEASSEIRGSIVYATAIVILVFVPLFNLGGIEGRMFTPLGLAYVLAVAASLLVALTVTPVLCYFVLGRFGIDALPERDSLVVSWLKRRYRRLLESAFRHPGRVLSVALGLLIVAVSTVPFLGGDFLPPFREGTLNINTFLPPGTSLAESNRIGALVEATLHEIPEVVSTTRRTGRGERDEHAAGVSQSELEVVLSSSDRSHEEIVEEARAKLATVPGLVFEVGQPISHRIDHLLSGTRAQIAIKLFGPDLATLRTLGERIRAAAEGVPGLVDLSLEPQVGVPQLQVNLDRRAAAALGLTAQGVADAVETAFYGRAVSRVLDVPGLFDIFVRLDDGSRASPEAIGEVPMATPSGARVPIAQIAEVRLDRGPNTIHRENLERRIVVQANVSGRDMASAVEDVRRAISTSVVLPTGYSIRYGGQFEAREKASRQILLLSLLSVSGVFLLLYLALGTVRESVLVMANLPLAFIGGVLVAAAAGGVLSVGSLVGFITLFGIATRNGIMLVSHYQHLLEREGRGFREAVVEGSIERLSPILMTALVTGAGLLPLVLGAGEPGKEIQQPMAVVILGGMVTSTFLNMIVVPVLYFKTKRGG